MSNKKSEMTQDEFFEMYYDLISKFPLYYLAYIEAERIHFEKFGRNKFTSRAVFRATLSRYLRKN